MYKNHEGYPDPTAGTAISKAMKTEKGRGGGTDMKRIYRGDIWTTDREDGKDSKVLVMGVHNEYCTTLPLRPIEAKENNVSVTAKSGIMYADAGKPGYTFNNRFVDYEKTINALELETVEDALLDALGIDTMKAEINYSGEEPVAYSGEETVVPEEQALPEEMTEPEEPVQTEEKKECCCAKKDLGHEIQITRLTAERDMMKGLYEDAVSRLMTM